MSRKVKATLILAITMATTIYIVFNSLKDAFDIDDMWSDLE